MRARLIKPGFFRDVKLLRLPVLTRHLFAGLWCLADRDGRLEDEPLQIKIDVLPIDDGDVDAMLNDLAAAGFIRRYQVDQRRYIQVTNFLKHQSPNVREPASTIPAPCEYGTGTIPAPDEHFTDVASAHTGTDTPHPPASPLDPPASLSPTPPIPTPPFIPPYTPLTPGDNTHAHAREAPATPATDTETPPKRYPADFERLWTRFPQKGRTDKPGAFAEFKRQRPSPDELDSGLTRWEQSQRWADGFIVSLKKWLHERRFEEEPEPAGRARASPNGRHITPSKVDIIREGLGLTDDRGRTDEGPGAAALALAPPGRQPADRSRAAPALP